VCALPAFGQGIAPAISEFPAEDPASPFLPEASPLAPGPTNATTAADADASAPTANRTWRGAQGNLGLQPRGVARFSQYLGDARVVGPALLASYVTGRFTGLPEFSAASARVAGATFGAALLCEGLQFAVGRARPDAAPREPGAFGRHDETFPSGQTTIAFAAASAIATESQARWVRWVVYPVAATAGLAQVQNGHGWGDVAAGAVLGFWTGRTVDRIERGQVRIFDRARFLVRGSPRSFRVGFKARF
jgi:membrane-associated phospholipid phosphatase